MSLGLGWVETTAADDGGGGGDDLNASAASGAASAGVRSGYWSMLLERGISYKALISLIFHFMYRGQKIEASAAERELALKATSLYFVLLSVPGSGAYKIFHPVLYNKALETFKLASKLQIIRYSPKKKRQQAQKRQQPASRVRKRQMSRESHASSQPVTKQLSTIAFILCTILLL